MCRISSPALIFAVLVSVIRVNATLQRSEVWNNANLIVTELQSKYWNGISYNGGERWTDVNALEDLYSLMLATGSDTYRTVADSSFIGLAASDSSTDWNLFFGGSYDDAQWAMLALWKISDYKASRGLDCNAYNSSSFAIYDIVAAEWDSTCGGGVWWSSEHTYKNAITNELFLLTSAEAYLRTKNNTYLENAIREWEWLSASGMQGPDGLFNDGLNLTTCKNNGQTTWTYNQAVVASGLGALYVADNFNVEYLEKAQVSLDATMHSTLTHHGVLKESCDDAKSGGSKCDNDQKLFKGLWMKHVEYFLDWANDASITAKYTDFLGAQYEAVWHKARNMTNDIGSVWYARNHGGSEWGPQSSTSGLEAVISAAKYGPC